jgi:hypothetical protein
MEDLTFIAILIGMIALNAGTYYKMGSINGRLCAIEKLIITEKHFKKEKD